MAITTVLRPADRRAHRKAGAQHVEDARLHLLDAVRNFVLSGDADLNPHLNLALSLLGDTEAKLADEEAA